MSYAVLRLIVSSNCVDIYSLKSFFKPFPEFRPGNWKVRFLQQNNLRHLTSATALRSALHMHIPNIATASVFRFELLLVSCIQRQAFWYRLEITYWRSRISLAENKLMVGQMFGSQKDRPETKLYHQTFVLGLCPAGRRWESYRGGSQKVRRNVQSSHSVQQCNLRQPSS